AAAADTTKTSEEQTWIECDVAGFLMQDTDLREFLGPVAAGTRVKFSPGGELGFTLGGHITDWLDIGLQGGVGVSRISSITGSSRVEAGVINFPFLMDADLALPCCGWGEPFIAGRGVL